MPAMWGRQQEHAGVAIANEHSALAVDVCCIVTVELVEECRVHARRIRRMQNGQ